jgi:hypothetical protein
MPEISETFHTLKLAQIGENASILPMILPDFRMPINEARSIVLPNAP